MSADAALQKYGVTGGSAALPSARAVAEGYGGSAPLPPGLIQAQRSEVSSNRAAQ